MAVAFVLKGYPRLSETFIAQEIRALEQRGLDIRIVSLRHPTDTDAHPVHREIQAPILYLPEYLHHEPMRAARAIIHARTLPGFAAAFATWRADLRRDFTRNRIRRFGQACVLAHELPPGVDRLHAHFLHTPASVARYAAIMKGLPWSGSAHAKDIWTTPAWDIREKLESLDWLVTCTQAGADYLQSLAPTPSTVSLVHHGLDFSRFTTPDAREKVKNAPLIILSVGRAVAKKGYDDCLQALASLPPQLDWRFRHIGGGPLLSELRERARGLGLDDRIEWLGAQPQNVVLSEMRRADIFVLPSKQAPDGDRDGLPNVLMEAQSQRVAVVSTRLSGIPELVLDRETGLLVTPGDAKALSSALRNLLEDSALRSRLAQAGFERVRSRFSMDDGIDSLSNNFGLRARPAAA
ncbi:MAG: glycosyltransferase family 4 protein [Rhodospirillaceae bacterium]|nr:glycosyltransferase family 4 protein [Rhodospirillaceae bacterium]MBT5664792.1 glycosyltransferase family 4 protein [Rhodospirillaceae bacterium]MBT5810471.1 glycosyltransferase family 4 protein [Rhodospirillaceae bacterium]